MGKCSDLTSKHRSCSPRKQRYCCRDRRNESISPCFACCSHERRARSCSPVKECRPHRHSLCPPPCDPCCRQRCHGDPCESYLIKRYARSCRGCTSPRCTDCNPCSYSNPSRYPCAPRSKTDTFLSRYDFLCCPPQPYTPYYPVENDPCCPPKADRFYNSSSILTSRLLDSCSPKKYDPCSLDKFIGLKKCDPCFPIRFDPCNPCPINKYDNCFSRKLPDPCILRKPPDPCFPRKPPDPCFSRNPEDPCFTKKLHDPWASRKWERECPDKCVQTCPDKCVQTCPDKCMQTCHDRGNPSVFKRYSTDCRVPCEPPCVSAQKQETSPLPQAHDPCADKKEYIPCRKITPTCETIVLSKCERPRQEEGAETRILTAKISAPSCDKFNKVCYPREVPVKCERHCEATTSAECERREKKECPEDVKIPVYKPADPCCHDVCNSQETSRQFLDKFNALGTLPRFERHMCPWEANVTVNGNVRAHCDSTAVEIAKKMTGCYKAHGERCTTDSCGQIPVECDEGDQHLNLGILDDGTCLDFSRNNRLIRDKSTNTNNQVYKTPGTSKPGSSGHCRESTHTPRGVHVRPKSSLRFQNSSNEPSTPSPGKPTEKASTRYYEVVVSQDGTMTKRAVDFEARRYKHDFVEVKECSAPSQSHLVSKGSISRHGVFSHSSKFQAQVTSPSVSSDDITPSYHTATQGSEDCGNLSDELNDFLRHRKSQRRLHHGEEAVLWPDHASAMPHRLSPDSFKNRDFMKWHQQMCQHERHTPDRTCHGHLQHYDDDSSRQEEATHQEREYSTRGSNFLVSSRKFRSANRETN